jgi:hypothetical protein
MKTQWKIYALLFGLCLPLLAGAQLSRVENQAGYWTLGFNGGWSYQSSDIRAATQGFGFGATLAKNLYYTPGGALSFDLRGRLLFARQFGLDPFRSYDILNNETLNGDLNLDYANYPAQLNVDRGFVFQNHRTDVFELGLEGVFTFNRLRENTGIIASLYGGFGLDWYLTKTDQADAGGNEYFGAYASLDENVSKSNIRNELRNAILDGNYESLADQFEDAGKIGLMPSVGFELGYEVTPNFSLFAGHRLTFSGTDLLDGHQWENANNDLYHYTNFGLRWKIDPYRRNQVVVAPEIEVTRPYTDPYRTRDVREGFVRADVRHINSQSDMECRLNGREIPFNYSYGTFEVEFPLEPGRNEIQIFARNSIGSVSKTVVIILEETVTPPPVAGTAPSIVITNPPYPEYPTNEQYYLVRAVIERVTTRDGVSFFLNGQSHPFNYNIANGAFSAEIPLREGRNELQIIARNPGGEREAASSLILEVAALPPAVEILEPAADYVETTEPAIRILAAAGQVERREQITVLINGRQTNNFVYNPATGDIEVNIPLEQGDHTVEIIATTDDGTASDLVSIVRQTIQPQRPRPEVRIEVPSQRQVSTFNPGGDFQAQVRYVDRRSDISLEINGQRTNSFEFANGIVRANIPLSLGENEVRITGYNESGSASDVVYILREREVIPANPPGVSIRYPRDREEVRSPTLDFRADTRNVLRKGDVELLINNRRSYSFAFNSFNGQVSANIPLEPGRNDIAIRVNNADGQNEDRVSVFYQPPLPPTVRIISPRDGFRTRESSIRVQAVAQYVDRMNQIGFFMNNDRIGRFDFSGARGEIVANVPLRPGRNVIRIAAQNADGQAEDQIIVFSEQLPAPVVRIDRPANNSTVDRNQIRLEASVQNVSDRNDIQVDVNGRNISGFNYDNRTNSLSADIILREGNNIIRVEAVNSAGRDQASVNINYEPLRAPMVTITEPGEPSAESTGSSYTIQARTSGVSRREDISVSVNGQNDDRFSWNSGTGALSLPVELKDGENRIRITVRNAAGQAEDNAMIIYQAPQPPEVTIEQPNNEQRLAEDRAPIRARIAHVDSRRNVIFKVNGSYRTDFNLDGEEFTYELTGLREGRNTFSISVSNRHGRDFDERAVYYEPVRAPSPKVEILSVSTPVVDFNNPGYGLSKVTARIENVTSNEQISLKVNGQNVADFTFRPSQQNLEANLLLERGKNNVILIEARNEAGTVSDRREIKF